MILGISPIRRACAALVIWCVIAVGSAPSWADRKQVVSDVAQMEREHRDAAIWNRRRTELRGGFLKGAGLWPLPKQGPLSIIRFGLRKHDGYTVENVAVETLPGFYCTGNLYRPDPLPKSCPGMFCPHGHFKPLGRFRAEHQIRCAHFAQMGAAVFSYGMVGWQDSQQTTHDDPLVLALQTWNSLKAVDFVLSLEGVDPARIGVTGASGGGTQTLYLTFLDDRIKASAPVVILYPWTVPEGCCKCEGGLPVMQQAHSNCIEFAASIAPRPQLIISVGLDSTSDFPVTSFPLIRQAYASLHAPAEIENVHLPKEKHDYGPSKRAAAYAFFARHLALDLTPEDARRIAIEEPAEMEVFNTRRPLPPGAISGSAAIAKALASLPKSSR